MTQLVDQTCEAAMDVRDRVLSMLLPENFHIVFSKIVWHPFHAAVVQSCGTNHERIALQVVVTTSLHISVD